MHGKMLMLRLLLLKPKSEHRMQRLLAFLIVCHAILSSVGAAPIVDFPLSLQQLDYATGNMVATPRTFALSATENPWRAIRQFCWKATLHAGDCAVISPYLLSLLQKVNETLVDTLQPYEDDVILHSTPPSENNACSYLDYNVLKLRINLAQLGGQNVSDYLTISAFAINVEGPLIRFCDSHALRGIHCRELSFEVQNYLTSLYYRTGGITLRNMMQGMYYQDYLQYVYIEIDHADTRYFFAQYPSHFLPSIRALCAKHQYNRTQCTGMLERMDRELSTYYVEPSTELSFHLYLLRSLDTILQNRNASSTTETSVSVIVDATDGTASAAIIGCAGPVAVPVDQVSDFIDGDFIEIGTSNFNTITQLVDASDPVTGFAVEPSMHYLSSLPNKPGVTKVNCAIVAHSTGHNSTARTLPQFLTMHRIRKIRLLKIDAEGYDMTILDELYHYLVAKNDPTLYPERILFENIPLDQRSASQLVVNKYSKSMDYRVVMVGKDVILERLPFTARNYVTQTVDAIIRERKLAQQFPSTTAAQPSIRQHGTNTQSLTNYVDADFIEIGTSNFDTITQYVLDDDNIIGFAVEPSVHYLSSLPVKRGVTKVNCAIIAADTDVAAAESDSRASDYSGNNKGAAAANTDTVAVTEARTVDLYHIPESVIEALDLQSFLRGCNSIGSYHTFHTKLNLTQHVVIDKVPAYTIAQLLGIHRIRKIRLLKIDAEGYDMTILDELYHYLVAKNDPILYPERILFESNDPDHHERLQELIEKYRGLGYLVAMTGDDTVLKRIK